MSEKTILLVEDDFLNRRLTRKILVENGFRVLEAKNALETSNVLARESVDLLILDINLGENEQDGISIGQMIQKKYALPYIYLTAYENPEIINMAVSSAPYSYLTKPFKNVDLITAVELAIRQAKGQSIKKPAIAVKDDEYTVDVPIEEIEYFESEGNYLLVYANDNIYKMRATIREILAQLPETTFVQTQRAFVINKNKIEKYNTNTVIIKNKAIPVSKNYYGNLR